MTMVSSKQTMRFIMRLVKGKNSKSGRNSSVTPTKQQEQQKVDLKLWPSRSSSSTTNGVNQHSSSSFELINPHHSKESNCSTGSKSSSILSLKEVVGDGAIVFQYKELSRATNNFSPCKKIGNSVYKGTGRDGLEFVISIHKKGDMYTDLVPKLKTLCSFHHSNVISMMGACSSENGDYVYAVFPFNDGARLRDCLRSAHSPGFCVLNTWTRRLQVAVDVAKGLDYLHEGTSMPMVHKYVKSNNILVDSKTLRAKIAQFGVADLAGEVPPVEYRLSRITSSALYGLRSRDGAVTTVVDEPWSPVGHRPRLSRSRSRKLTGTRGYMAPEYMESGSVTSKLDVFAFGVVLLELLSGQEAIVYRPDTTSITNTYKRFSLFESIRTVMEDDEPKAKLRQWMDPLLKDSYPLDLALKVAQLGKSCVETDPALRPEMRTVAFDLSRILIVSEKWEASMLASKDLMTTTLEGR
ncbi:unnamed protein product [Calypogeia fissa]